MNDAQRLIAELDGANKKFAVKRLLYEDLKADINLHHQGKLIKPLSTGIAKLASHFNFHEGMLCLLTGYPGSGKTELMKFLAFNQAKSGNKVAIFSPESITAILCDEIVNIAANSGVKNSEEFVQDNFVFLEINGNDGMPEVDQLLQEFEALSLEDFKFFVIDPMNWITSSSYQNQNIAESLRIILTKFKQFAQRTKSVFLYIEHPKTPSPNKDGKYPLCNIFMVHGGTMHWKKIDGALIVHRLTSYDGMSDSDDVDLEVAKLKNQKYLGRPTTVQLDYDYRTGIYK